MRTPGRCATGGAARSPRSTDAALVSGLIDPGGSLGGGVVLDVRAATQAIRVQVADVLGLSVTDAAAGIVALTEANMAALLEGLTIEKGHDPRDFAILAFGGGGSLVGGALAARLEIPRVIVPPSPGTFSAWGMLTLDIVHDFSRTALTGLVELGREQLAEHYGALEEDAHAALEREGVPDARASDRHALSGPGTRPPRRPQH